MTGTWRQGDGLGKYYARWSTLPAQFEQLN